MLVMETLDSFRLVSMGKLSFVSNDEKKTVGVEPISIDRFVQEHKRRFVPGRK